MLGEKVGKKGVWSAAVNHAHFTTKIKTKQQSHFLRICPGLLEKIEHELELTRGKIWVILIFCFSFSFFGWQSSFWMKGIHHWWTKSLWQIVQWSLNSFLQGVPTSLECTQKCLRAKRASFTKKIVFRSKKLLFQPFFPELLKWKWLFKATFLHCTK